MNLCIDQGNSRTKIALFKKDGRIVKNLLYKSFTSADVERLFSLYPITQSIVSSVANMEPAVINALNRLSKKFVLFDHLTPLPIKNCYQTPETLGHDRIAAAVGAAHLCPGQNLLIVDAGSAVTYDFVSAEQGYLGGNIAPGIKMRLTVLHQMTKKLPQVEVEQNALTPLFGKNTKEAIAAGVVRGVVFEVKGYMRALSEQGIDFVAFATGGHAPYILNGVKDGMRHEPNLVLIGLNKILEYNMHGA
ncbi:MAG: type III pantothenate kinase [Paludibacteraceae bacterium]|nr:type III pantothenate kinase [Paludibacteraceae bacterium]